MLLDSTEGQGSGDDDGRVDEGIGEESWREVERQKEWRRKGLLVSGLTEAIDEG